MLSLNALLHHYAQRVADNYDRALLPRIGFEHVYQLLLSFGSAGLLQTGMQNRSEDQANTIAIEYLEHPLQAVFRLSDGAGPTVM